MSSSKQFFPKNTSTSPIRHSNVKVWGQQSKRPSTGLDRANSISQSNKFKSFTADKDKISKIFAPKLTVIDNNVSIGKKEEVELQNVTNKVKATTVSPQSSGQISTKPYEQNETYAEKQNSLLRKNEIQQGFLARDGSEADEVIQSNGKLNFLNALIPKISIGKFTFGGFKEKNPHPASPTGEEKHSTILTGKESILSQNKYDPESIFNNLNSNKKQETKAKFFHHIKNYSTVIASNWWDSIKFDFYDKQWFRKLNYQFVAFDIAKNINRLIVGLCIFSFLGFFTYLSFFDQYFTIKKYTVEYISGSYLNNQQTFDLISHFQKNKLYKVFPNNQYWFANNLSLTASAKEIFPEIKNVNIKNRQWPDKVSLQVETNKPILTLWVTENNEQKYWRINENGKISSQDKAAIWYNLVKVEKPYSVQGDPSQQLSLFNHSFENDPSQKQRFKLTKKLLDYFKTIDIDITSTIFPSISDTDIIMESSNGTKFLFDSLAFESDLQIERLDYFLKSKTDKYNFYELHKRGDYAYFDFRITHKAHICKFVDKCNIKTDEASSK
jgi:hypothetical protein